MSETSIFQPPRKEGFLGEGLRVGGKGGCGGGKWWGENGDN